MTIISNEEQKLFYKLDIIALIASIFVISIHTSVDTFYAEYIDVTRGFDLAMLNFTNLIRVYLANFAVPYFFVRAGMLFFRNFSVKVYPQKLKSRFFSLLIPFVVWNLIAYVFDVAITKLPVISNYIYQRSTEPLTGQELYRILVEYKYHPFNWFLASLIVYVVISPVLWLLLQNRYLSIAGLIGLVIGTHYTSYITRYLIWFYLGGILGRYCYQKLQEKSPLPVGLALLLLIGSFCAYIAYGSEHPMEGQMLIQCLELVAIWSLADLGQGKETAWWMKTSFFIYESQIILASSVTKLTYLLLPRNAFFMALNLVITMVVTPIIANGIYYFLDRYCKWSLCILAGSR